jgi:uncharacterized protein
MTLRSRLSLLQAQAGKEQKSRHASAHDSPLRQRLAGIRTARITAEPAASESRTSDEQLAKRLRGYRIAEGVIQIEQRLSLKGSLGQRSLAMLRNSLRLPGEGREAHLRQVYVDTETTGLSGGSGTVAFLIGMALVDEDALVVTQYLMTRFSGESAMLESFSEALSLDDRLVSYNGKSFDLPLLLTRYRMQAVPQCFTQLPHLDLLHPVRRLFAAGWPDCRLLTLEDRLLGFRRQHDLPGSEAPAAWADYLRQGRAEKLIQVVEHNRQDIVSLALAHAMLASVIDCPEAYEIDIVSLAQWLSASDRAAAYALLRSTGQPLDGRGKRLLAQWARGAQEWDLALGIWEELSKQGCRQSAEELAKYHEHVSRDLNVAKQYCQQMKPGNDRRRRLERIEAKQYRLSVQTSLSGFAVEPK